MRKKLHTIPNWVIVKENIVFEYDTFDEATAVNSLMGGHLMSKNYYEHHYKKDKNVTTDSNISDNWD